MSLSRQEVSSIRSIDRRLCTLTQTKTALTLHDKMQMVDKTNCIPYGYGIEAARQAEELEK